MAQMQPNSLAVFNSNDIYPISADSTMPFEQHRDIFYLSGVDQEESILVLFPDCPKAQYREMLFLKETNDHIAVWEGEKLTKEAAFKTAGIKTVFWLQDLEKIFAALEEKFAGEDLNKIDGLKINYPNSWVHLRKSNTEPIIRIYSEAETRESADKLVTEIKASINNI